MRSQGQNERQPDDFSGAIRKLRRERSLTQVQLANALGIAPTSVYRWEAGSSVPDMPMLVSLWHFALESGSAAATVFSDALTELAGPLKPLFETSSRARQSVIDKTAQTLEPEQQILVMAFIEMVRRGADPVSEKVMRLLLEPWLGSAVEQLTTSAPKIAADAGIVKKANIPRGRKG